MTRQLLAIVSLSQPAPASSANRQELTVPLPTGTQWNTSNPLGETVVCEFAGEVVAALPKGERAFQLSATRSDQPLRTVFTGVGTRHPRTKGNGGEAPLRVMAATPTMLVLVEDTAFGNQVVYTLLRDKKVAFMSKAYDLLGMPFGTLSIGTCY